MVQKILCGRITRRWKHRTMPMRVPSGTRAERDAIRGGPLTMEGTIIDDLLTAVANCDREVERRPWSGKTLWPE